MIKKAVFSLMCLAIVVACSSSNDDGPRGSQTADDFNRQTMLINWADNIIIPAYQDLTSKLEDLVSKKNSFIETPNQTNLEQMRASWLAAYKTWQYVELFDIGKAEEIAYASQMNIYPTNTDEVQANIASGTYDLANANNNDAVGFPTVDFMINGLAANDLSIIAAYATNSNAEANKSYLSDIVDQMRDLTSLIKNDWMASYRDQFVGSTSNTATSSTNKLTNDFIYYFESGLRANKIGIPAGQFSAMPFSSKVEAYYYKDASKMLALEGLKAVQDFFNGKAYNSSSTSNSFKTYLDYLNTIKGGEDLSTLINSQFDEARTKLQAMDDNFAQQVETDNSKMVAAYDALQQSVVLLKVDMIQAMSISLDFADSDGD